MKTEHVETIDSDTLYTATITFQSKGLEQGVRQITKYSHTLPDGYDGLVPSSYLMVRDINMALAQYLQMMAARELGIDFENMSDENIDAILEHTEKLGGTKH